MSTDSTSSDRKTIVTAKGRVLRCEECVLMCLRKKMCLRRMERTEGWFSSCVNFEPRQTQA